MTPALMGDPFMHLVGDAAKGDDRPVLNFKRHVSRRFVRAKKFVTVEMNHMVRRVGNPDFRFPCNIRRIFSEGVAIKKRCDENDVSGAALGEPF